MKEGCGGLVPPVTVLLFVSLPWRHSAEELCGAQSSVRVFRAPRLSLGFAAQAGWSELGVGSGPQEPALRIRLLLPLWAELHTGTLEVLG